MHELAIQIDPSIAENLQLGDRHTFEKTSQTEAGVYEMYAESPRVITLGLVHVVNGIDIIDTSKSITLYRNGGNTGVSARKLIAKDHQEWLSRQVHDEKKPLTSTSP